MKNIERRGARYRAQLYSRGVRLSKTFGTPEDAAAWVLAKKQLVASGVRLSLQPTGRRRSDYGVITFSAARSSQLESADKLVASAMPRAKVCGVYFLIVAGRIMYVGQSTDAHFRIAFHAQARNFESFHVIPCKESEACLLESRYIVALDPPWNRGRDGSLILSVTREAFAA